MSDKQNPEEVEETTETTENEYLPGAGNAVLDSLFSIESGSEAAPKPQEEEIDPPPEETASSIAMSLTDSLAAIADSPPEEPDPPEEEDVQEDVQEQEEPALKKEDLSEGPDYFDEIDKHLSKPGAQQQEDSPEVLSNMSPEDLEEYHMAAYASRKYDKHSDAEKEYLEFHAKKRDFLQKAKEEDPEFEESLENPEYAEFVSRNRPSLTAADRRKIEKSMLKDEVMGEVRGEMSRNQQVDALKKRAPVIDKRAQEYLNELASDILPEEVKQTLDNGGLEVARVQHAMEMPTLHSAVTEAHAFGSLFLQLSNGIVAYDSNNGQHKTVLEFVEGQGEIFAKQGGKDRFRGKSKFVPRSKYHQLADKSGFWTFSDNEILEMVKFYAKQNADSALESVRSKVEAYSAGTPKAKPEKKKTPAPAPKARPTKSTGATSSVDESKSVDNPVLSVLGL